MEKKGDLLNQLAIISDLIENLNTETEFKILTLELKDVAFLNAFELIQKNTEGKWTNRKIASQSLLVWLISFLIRVMPK